MVAINRKSECVKRLEALRQENQAFIPAYKDLSKYIAPKRGRFDESRSAIGQMIDHKTILDGHATRACEILASGLSSGMTNKSQEWFKPVMEDPELSARPHVRRWLDQVQKILLSVCEGSNIYGVFYSIYKELGIFGTGCYIINEDFDEVIRARSFTAGEYYLGADDKGRINTFARKFWMQVGQVVETFGLESCSMRVKADYQNNQVDRWVLICHLIEPNDDRFPGFVDVKNMAYRSCYWESGEGTDQFLAIRGYRRFPVVAPRWETTTTDQVYGYGPGWNLLGDVKQLQKTVLDKLLAQEKLHNPPMQADGSVEGSVNLLPGGISRTSATTPNAGLKPAYQIDPRLDSFIELINGLKDAIDRYYFVNLFLMLMNVDKTNMTATEVAERQQEKVMMMGPILHKLDEEMLTPTLEIIFDICQENGLIPEPPPEIQGMKVKIQYISILAQAQRAIGVSAIQRTLGLASEIVAATANPAAMEVIDLDEVIREVADLEGMPAKLLKDPQALAAERQQRAQMQQAAAATEMANSAADTTKKLADSKMGQGSALDGIMQGVAA